MIDIKSAVKDVSDKKRWTERRASFVAKVKATQAVWFPPKPAATGKKATRTVKKASGSARKRTTGAAKKTAKSAGK